MRRILLLGLATVGCVAASQITITQSMDVAYVFTGTPATLSIGFVPGETTITVLPSAGSPSLSITSGVSPLDYMLTAQANHFGDKISGSVDAVSDTLNVSETGTVDLNIEPTSSFDLTMSGPTLASETVSLAVQEFDTLTSQWNDLTSVFIHSVSTTSSPSSITCLNCLSDVPLVLSNSSEEFRLHSHLDFSIELDAPVATTPEPGTLGLLGVPFAAVVVLMRGLRRRARGV